MDRVAIKKEAKEFAYANKWNIWKGLLLVSILSSIVTSILEAIGGAIGGENPQYITGVLTFLAELALAPLTVGLCSYILKLVRGKEVNLTEELFKRYKDGSAFKIILVTFVAGLIIGAGYVLLIIPGIIAALGFTFTSFILAESTAEEMEKEAAWKTSWNMMNGHKGEYFVFLLSFLGWFFLVGLTFGILGIWIVPYFTVANVKWYEELKKLSK